MGTKTSNTTVCSLLEGQDRNAVDECPSVAVENLNT